MMKNSEARKRSEEQDAARESIDWAEVEDSAYQEYAEDAPTDCVLCGLPEAKLVHAGRVETGSVAHPYQIPRYVTYRLTAWTEDAGSPLFRSIEATGDELPSMIDDKVSQWARQYGPLQWVCQNPFGEGILRGEVQ